MANYKGIEFAESYNRPFADFKNDFEQTHIFKNIPSLERENELKDAYKIATNENVTSDLIDEIEVIEVKEIKPDGNNIRTTSKSKETK